MVTMTGFPPNFQPDPLETQVEAIIRELDIAKKRLPALAQPGKRGQPAKLCWPVVTQRIHEYHSLALTLLVLKRLDEEGRLPPELAQLLQPADAPAKAIASD